jgi:hypothetical protein
MADCLARLDAERMLADVPADKVFRMGDSSTIKNLEELYDTLQTVTEDVFGSHVDSSKNDFGNWVRDVHKDYRLANSLFSCATKEECVNALGIRLYELEKCLEPAVALLPAPAQVEHAAASESELLEERLMKVEDLLPPAEAASIFLEEPESSAADVGTALVTGFFSEMASVFSAEGMSRVASDIKGMFRREDSASTDDDFIKDLALSVQDDGSKDRIISHLKKVYK